MAERKSSKQRAPVRPVSYLCESDAVEDVLGNCTSVLQFIRNVDLSKAADTERQTLEFQFGRSVILSSVIEALEYADQLHRHSQEVANV